MIVEYTVTVFIVFTLIEFVGTAFIAALYSANPALYETLKPIAIVCLGFPLLVVYPLIVTVLTRLMAFLENRSFDLFLALSLLGLLVVVPAIVFDLTHPTQRWLETLLVVGFVSLILLLVLAVSIEALRPRSTAAQIKPRKVPSDTRPHT